MCLSVEHHLTETFLYIGLDSSLQWAGTELHIVAFGCNHFLDLVTYVELVAHLFHSSE